jgi:hypothetical protein
MESLDFGVEKKDALECGTKAQTQSELRKLRHSCFCIENGSRFGCFFDLFHLLPSLSPFEMYVNYV